MPDEALPIRQPANTEKAKVLLVEDTWHIAEAMKGILESSGHLVSGPANSVAAARELLATSRPDIAVVDMNLQGELSTELIRDMNDEGVPVIVVSGYQDLLEHGGQARAVLSKPLRARDLLSRIREILNEENQTSDNGSSSHS